MIKADSLKRFFQMPGPLLSLTLIGILLLSAVLYYRAVKIQRFLEPALAISTPRFLFAKNVNLILAKEFGSVQTPGIRLTTNAIFVGRSLILSGGNRQASEPPALKKLGRVFLSVLSDRNIRDHIDFILIRVRYPAGQGEASDEAKRRDAQQKADLILQSLFRGTPGLAKEYGPLFSATSIPGNSGEDDAAWIEFRFMPSELLHIEALQSLKKYVH
jgi:hypothetical protein